IIFTKMETLVLTPEDFDFIVPSKGSPHCYLNSQLDLRQNGNGCALGVSGEASFG
uniref:Uncharacterized protein n=1 Tax=Canis lupus familiaris TaxID=9615 RepID=A0A8C0Q9P2_CANLF